MSRATANLKEAAGKALARRTEIAYEAWKLDEKAKRFKVQYLYGKLVRRCGGHKREGESALPRGDLSACHVLPASRGDGKSWQKSAEGIVGPRPD